MGSPSIGDHLEAGTFRALAQMSSIYRITLDELQAYDYTRKNERRIHEARARGQNEFLMIMLREDAPPDETVEVVSIVDKVRGKNRMIHSEKMAGLERHPYVLVTEPELIERIKAAVPSSVRSFKEDLFPDGPVEHISTLPDRWYDHHVIRQR